MPIYEYQCSECEHRLEALQKISDPLLTDCPECGNSALKKLVSAASFRLKGGGWYETDFKKDGKKHLAESDSAVSTPKKSDSKTDKKADTASGSSKSSDSNNSSSGKAKSQPAS
ncbi:MAG: zinc ribbon domain-containing protein [Gammaproteobacteria bacterium]